MRESKSERFLRSFYSEKNIEGLSTVFTPKEVRDKMTVHANLDMKILVLFNMEFCDDLKKMGCEDVTFASDDEIRNEMVREIWGYKTELVNVRSINKTFENMKFDLIISNPPYNSGLDLFILESILMLSDDICFVHPIGYLYDNKQNKKYLKIKHQLSKRIKTIEIFDSNKIFDIKSTVPCGIIMISDKNNGSINIEDYSKILTISDKKYVVNSIEDIDKYGNSFLYKNIKHKIFSNIKISVHDIINENDTFKISLNNFGIGQINSPTPRCFYTLLKNDKKWNEEHNQPIKFSFKLEIELINFSKYLKTKFARFCISIVKNNQNIHRGELKFLPSFDFTRSWTDQECAAELKITDEELLWMIQQIPDYYTEDAEVYRKLEKELSQK